MLGASSEKITSLIEVTNQLVEMNYFTTFLSRDALMKTLIQISNGEKIPVPIFNCLSLDWVANGSKYPSVYISDDIGSSITRFNRKNIKRITTILNSLGNPDYYIIVPDSEIFDERVWPFVQDVKDRSITAMSLKDRVQYLFPDIKTIFWSEYCSKYELKDPQEYTRSNYEKIISNPILMKKIIDSQTNIRMYFSNYIGEKQAQAIKKEWLLDRTIWYFAMYMGEGQGLKESGALSINFEEGNVPKWFQIGAGNNLAIISPSKDIYSYYKWRNNPQNNELIDFPKEISNIIEKATNSNPLIVYIPWGFRKTSSFGGKELNAMDIIDKYLIYLSEKRVPFRVLLMTTTPYWTEINGYDKKIVTSYYENVKDEGKARGYDVVDWDDLRENNLEWYFELCEYWTEEKIKSLIPTDLLEKSKRSAKNISQRKKELGVNAATLIYDRERIIEAQMILELFPNTIKFSMAPNGGINDYLDMDLPRMFPLPEELSFPWWPERRAKK